MLPTSHNKDSCTAAGGATAAAAGICMPPSSSRPWQQSRLAVITSNIQQLQQWIVWVNVQGLVLSDAAAAMLSEPELQASDLVPNKYEGGCTIKQWPAAAQHLPAAASAEVLNMLPRGAA